MRKLSEIKGEEALDVMAEILVPLVEIVNDGEVKVATKGMIAKGVSLAIKKHKSEVMEIVTAINGNDDFSFIEVPAFLIDLLNDPTVEALFT